MPDDDSASRPPAEKARADVLPWLLTSPLIIFIVVLALVPAAFTVGASFFKVQALNPPVRFNGLDNFIDIFTNGVILRSMGNTVVYMVIGVVLSTILGILFALVLQRGFSGRSVLVAILILPWAIPGVVQGLIWANIFDANSGLLNSHLYSFGAISHYQVFIGTQTFQTIFLIELVQVWQITPLATLLILASLQNVPHDLYEQASIDGASPMRSFWSVTLPLIRPGVTIAMVQAVIATLNIFDRAFVLNGAAATGNTITMQTYFTSFQDLNFGEGYALSLLITLATLLVSFVVLKLVYRPVEY